VDEIEKEEKQRLQDDADSVPKEKVVGVKKDDQSRSGGDIADVQEAVYHQEPPEPKAVGHIAVLIGVFPAAPAGKMKPPERNGDVYDTPDDGVEGSATYERPGQEQPDDSSDGG
jgi:hypothetical protein